jgi:hypothetical protein
VTEVLSVTELCVTELLTVTESSVTDLSVTGLRETELKPLRVFSACLLIVCCLSSSIYLHLLPKTINSKSSDLGFTLFSLSPLPPCHLFFVRPMLDCGFSHPSKFSFPWVPAATVVSVGVQVVVPAAAAVAVAPAAQMQVMAGWAL